MGYIHGYNKREQKRLCEQAKLLEPYIYPGVELSRVRHLLEVGCGVGAQTRLLLKHFPQLRITGVDLSDAQLEQAGQYLKRDVARGRVHFEQQDAMKLKMDRRFDAAFLCWFLEHVPDPLTVLKQVRKQLRPGAPIYCTEVFNSTLFLHPYSPSVLKYWFEFNDRQWELKGHPFVGGRLGHLLKEAGFKSVETEIRDFHFDSRQPKRRAEFIRLFRDIFLSAAPELLKDGRVDRSLLASMKREFSRAARVDEAVFFYAFVRATARA